MNDEQIQEIEDVYRLLCRGLGRERVNAGNAEALLRRAEQDGRAVLAEQLRDWLARPGAGPWRPSAEGVTARSRTRH